MHRPPRHDGDKLPRMPTIRVALANIRIATSPGDSVELARQAITDAGSQRADIVCFPECYVPGYRWPGRVIPPPDTRFLEGAWSSIASAAGAANVAVILGTERLVDGAPRLTALVIDRDGTSLGFQDKVQLDPSEEGIYQPGHERRLFTVGALTFGVGSAMKDGAIRKPCGGRPGVARRWCFIRTTASTSPATIARWCSSTR